MSNKNFKHKYICVDTNGKKHHTSDLTQFCLAYKLDYSAMVNVANGYVDNYKGWDCMHYRDAIGTPIKKEKECQLKNTPLSRSSNVLNLPKRQGFLLG